MQLHKIQYLNYDASKYGHAEITHIKVMFVEEGKTYTGYEISDPQKIEEIFAYINQIPVRRVFLKEPNEIDGPQLCYCYIDMFSDDINIGWIMLYDQYIYRHADLHLFRKNTHEGSIGLDIKKMCES